MLNNVLRIMLRNVYDNKVDFASLIDFPEDFLSNYDCRLAEVRFLLSHSKKVITGTGELYSLRNTYRAIYLDFENSLGFVSDCDDIDFYVFLLVYSKFYTDIQGNVEIRSLDEYENIVVNQLELKQ